ncbi:MAG: hypothetical protein AB3N22_13720 [Ruegeria sp.]
MHRNTVIWTGMGLLYAAFLSWHISFSPALSPLEWRQSVHATGMDVDDLPPEFAAFFDGDDGRAFLMINILDHADSATYPPGPFAHITDASEAARRYGTGVVPKLFLRGSYPLLQANRIVTLLNDIPAEADRFEALAVVRYRSRRDFLDLLLDPGFQDLTVHKWASLDGTIVIPAQRVFVSNLALWVPLALIVLGTGLTLRRRS